MSEKKVVRRNVAIALAVICVILGAALIGAIAQYTSTVNDRDSLISSKNSEMQTLQANLDGNCTALTETQNSLSRTQACLDGNITALNQIGAQYHALAAASLTCMCLSVINFNHQYSWDPSSHLTFNGYIINIGANTAYNCVLHVKVWSSQNVLLKDTTIAYGSILGRSALAVTPNTEVDYDGVSSSWLVTPECTTNP